MVADDTGVLALIRGSEAGLTVKVLGRPELADYNVKGYQHSSRNFERNAAVQKDYNTRESTALANMDEYKRIIENNTLKSDDRFLTSYQMAHGHHHDTSVFPTANFPIQRVAPALKHQNYKNGVNRHCGTFYVRRTPNYNYWPNQGITYGFERSTANRDLEAFENSLRKYDYVPLTPSKSADYTHRTHTSKRRTSTRSNPRRAKSPNPTTVKPPNTTYKPPDTAYRPPVTTYRPPDTTYKPPDTTYKPPEVQIPKLTQSPHTIADSDLMFDYLRAERQYRQSNRRVYFDLSCPLMLSEARLRSARLGGCGPYNVTMCRKLLQRYQRHLDSCPKSDVEFTINRHIEVWQNEIPVYPDESREQRCTRHRMINKLREDLISIPNGPAFMELARQITKECVETLPMWLPQESTTAFKERIAQSLLNKLNDRVLFTVQANSNFDIQSINNSLLDGSDVITDAGPRNGLSSGCEVCDRRGTVSECVGCDQRILNSGNATDGQFIAPELCDRPVCDCVHENLIPSAVREGSKIGTTVPDEENNVSEEAGPSKKKTKDKSNKGKPASPRRTSANKKRKSSSKAREPEKSISENVRINNEKKTKGNDINDNANSVSKNGNDNNLDNMSVTVQNDDDNRLSQILNGDNVSPNSGSLNLDIGDEVAETVINNNGNQISEIVNGYKENRASQIINNDKVNSENVTLNKSKTLNGNETSNNNKIPDNLSDSYKNEISRSLQNINNGNLMSDTVNNEIVNSNNNSFSNNYRESLIKNTNYNNRHSIEEIDNDKGNPISPTSKQNMTSETTTADNLIEKRTSKISNGKNKSDTSNNRNWISATTNDTNCVCTNANQVSDNVNNGYENRVSEIVSDTNGKRNSDTINTNGNKSSEILNNDNRNRLSQILNGNCSPDLVNNNNGKPISPKSNQNMISVTTTNNRNRISDILNNSDDNQVMNSYININSENVGNRIEKSTSKLSNGNNKSETINSSNGNWISATTNDTNTNEVSDNVNNGYDNRVSEMVSNTKRNSDTIRTPEILNNDNRNSPSQILNGNRSPDLRNNINGNHSPDLVNNNSGNRSPDNHSLDKWISDNIYRNCDKCITDGVNTCPGRESPPKAQNNQEPPISCTRERCIRETGRHNKGSKAVNGNNRSPPNEADGNYKKWISETVVRDYERLLSDTVARDTSKRPSLAASRDYQKRISDMIENNAKRVSATVSRNIRNLQGSTRDFEKMLLNRIPQDGGRRNSISGVRDYERSLLETTFGGRRASKSAPIDKRLSDNMVRNRRVSETAQTVGFDTSDRDTEYDASMVPQIVEANEERNVNTVTERKKMELPSKLNPIPEMDKESEISGSEVVNQVGSNNNNENLEPARPNRQDIENQIWDTISNTPELANINRSDVTDLVTKLAADLSNLTEDQMEEKEKIVIQFVQNLSRQVECAGCFMDPKIRYKIITKLLSQSLDIENEIWDIISAIKDLSNIPKCDITVLVRTLAGNLRTLAENKASDDEKENEIMQFLRKLAVKTGCHLCLLDPNIRDTFVATLLNHAPTTDELNTFEAAIYSAVGDLPEVLNMPKCLLDSKVKALARSLASNKSKYAKMVIDIVTFLQYVNCKTGCKINSKRRDDFCQNLMNVLVSQTKVVSAKSGVVNNNNNKNRKNNLNCSFKCAFTTDSYINDIYDKNENETTRLIDKCLVTFIARLPFEISDSEYFKNSIKSGILDWYNYVEISPSKHSDNEKYNGIKYLVFKRLKDATNTKDAVLALEHIECLIGQLKEIQTLRKDELISNKIAPELMDWTNVGLSTVADGDLVNKLQQNESKFASKTVQTDSKGCRRRRSTVSFDENSDQSNKATNTKCKRNTSKHIKGKSVSATHNNENISSDDEDDKNPKINNTIKVVTKIKKKRDFPIQTMGDLTRLSAEQQSISKYLAENKKRFLDDDPQQSLVPGTDTLLDDIEPKAMQIPPEDYNIDFFIGCKHTKCKSRKPMKLNQIFIDNNMTCSLKTNTGPWKSNKASKSSLGMSPKNSWYATVGHIEPDEQKSRPRRPLVKTCQGVKLDQSFELKKQRYRTALGLKMDGPFFNKPKTCDCKQSVRNCHHQCPYPSNMFFQP